MLDRIKAFFLGDTAPTQNSSQSEPGLEKSGNTPKVVPGWIGVDLDGTLAEYTAWKGIAHIGKPIPLMVKRVLAWRNSGYTVKIMTARASVPEGKAPIEAWLKKHGLPQLEITNQKDFQMIELWDDRAIQVIANRGSPVLRMNQSSKPKAPLLPDENATDSCELTK